jgi:hypothetical protein|tara:strand:- start:7855 stop:8178 length:324 start_codon:yes stop_codon:yes gene_type:complete
MAKKYPTTMVTGDFVEGSYVTNLYTVRGDVHVTFERIHDDYGREDFDVDYELDPHDTFGCSLTVHQVDRLIDALKKHKREATRNIDRRIAELKAEREANEAEESDNG